MVHSVNHRPVNHRPAKPSVAAPPPPPQVAMPSPAVPPPTTAAPSLQAVLDQPPAALPQRLTWGCLGFALIFGTWAWVGQVNEVAHAQGKLMPQGATYPINPSEVGKVAQVFVQEGETVAAGQVLMVLDAELAQQDVERLEKDLAAAQAELAQTRTVLAQAHLQAQFQSAMAGWGTQAQAVESSQAEAGVGTTQILLEQLNADAAAQQARLEKLAPLVAEGAIAQEQLFQVEQSLRDRQRTITEHQGLLVRSRSDAERLTATLEQKREEENKTKVDAQQHTQQLEIQVSQLQAKITQTAALIATARTKLKQRFVYAPVAGVVSTLKVRHSGAVVQPEQAIAEIAPSQQPLILSAILPNQEAGFVKLGMPVQVKLDAYPYADYGIVPGTVIAISPDTQANEQLGQVYRVDVKLDRNYVTKDSQRIPFKTGQTATAEIVTRQRRIADLLLDPIKQLRGGVSL
jgi:hemolysin D